MERRKNRMVRGSVRLRILSHIDLDDNGCWNWDGYCLPDGYAKMQIGHTSKLAHRQSYMAFVGEIPQGLELDHLCRNRKCVNPEHLEAVTPSVNVRRGNTIAAMNAAKTHCIRGHEFTPENTKLHKGKYRNCKICTDECKRRYKAKIKKWLNEKG